MTIRLVACLILTASISVGIIVAPRAAWAKNPDTRRAKLTWDEISDADHYELEVSAKPRMEPVISRRQPKATSESLKLRPGTYYYRVRGIDADNRPGPWSDVQGFVVTPYVPDQLAPTSGQVFKQRLPRDEVGFAWAESDKGAHYLFQLRDDQGDVVRRGLDRPKFNWKPDHPGKFQWRVGLDSPKGEQWGSFRDFTLEPGAFPPPKVLAKPLAPKAVVDDSETRPQPGSVWIIVRAAESVVAYTSSDLDTGKTSGGAALVGVYNAELRWRGAKRRNGQWLLSGSLNFELLNQSVLDAQFTLPRGYARLFANHELGEGSDWRAGPFVQASYGQSAIFVVQSAQSARKGTVTRYGGGVGGVVVYRPAKTFLLSFLALAREDFSGAVPAGVLPNALAPSLGIEAGFGVALEFTPRWMIEGRLRFLQENFAWQPAAGAGGGNSTLQDSFVILDVGFGFRF